MMRTIVLLLLSYGSLSGQVTCPPINWLAGPTVTMANLSNSMLSGLQRLSDGSFTQHNFRGRTAATAQRLTPVPHFEQYFYSCQGITPRVPTAPPGWRAGRDRVLGTQSKLLVSGGFLGDGSGFGACVSPCAANNKLLVGLFTADGALSNTATYDVGQNAAGIVAADLNGDGRPDLVVLNQGNFTTIKGSISVLLTNANGTLSGPTTISFTSSLLAGTAMDFNGDGKLDIALTTDAKTVIILLGNGDGAFRTPTTITNTQFTGGISAADFNGDGKPDIAFGDVGGVVVLPGNGDGTFQAARVSSFGGFRQFQQLGAADLNGDGKVDVVGKGGNDGEVAVMLGKGDGTFNAPTYYIVSNDDTSFYLTDFDWDGKVDIVMAEGHPDALTPAIYSPDITVLYGNGDGSFYGMPAFAVPDTVQELKVADFNNDGKPDVAVATVGMGVQVYLGRGNGLLEKGVALSGVRRSVVAVDLNNDGKTDIAAPGLNTIAVFNGNGDGTFQTASTFTVGRANTTLAAGDVNGDGVVDILGVEMSTGMVSVYLRASNGSLVAGASINAGSNPTQLQLADVDGDGKLDLVVTNQGTLFSTNDQGSAAVFLGNGNGTFKAGVTYPNGINPTSATLADVNGDGKLDLLTTGSTSTLGSYRLFIALNRGDGTFGSPAIYTVDFGPAAVAVADFNLDGKKDLIVSHCCGETELGFLAGNGDGTFQPEVLFVSGQDQSTLALADFNGDGKPGLVVGGALRLVSLVNRSTAGASVVTPVPGATLGAGAITFTWTAVAGATKYKLEIGNSSGGSDLFSQETTGTSLTVPNLPADGRTLYVRVTAFVNGAYGNPSATTYKAYTTPVPLRFVPLAPCRVMETRAAYNFEGRTGSFGPPALAAGSTRTLNLPVSNVCSIPSTAKAYVVNVTLIPNGAVDYVTVWPAGDPRPNVWTIRSPDGQIVANSAIVKAGVSGGISVYSSNNTDLLIDISGYYTDSTAASGLVYYPLTPCRVIDTRLDYRSPAGPFGPPSMTARQTRRFQFPSTPYCSVPEAAAYSVTITAVPPASLAYLTAWPSGGSQPNVSSINSFAGRVLANSVIVPASGGSIDVFAFDATDFIVDINGYYAPDDGQRGLFYYTVTQCRASDSTASGGAYPDDTARTINVPAAAGCSGIPSNARGYAINVTALPNGNPLPFITAYPTGQARPNASILNAFQGQVVTNSAIIPAGTNGSIDVYAFRRTDVVVEISGYFGR